MDKGKGRADDASMAEQPAEQDRKHPLEGPSPPATAIIAIGMAGEEEKERKKAQCGQG